jgi:Flp pilus assembly protein TadG
MNEPSTPSCDRGVATPVEMMYLLVFCMVAVLFVGFLGRLHATGVEVSNVAQSAARAASMAPTPEAAASAASAAVSASPLRGRCSGGARSATQWTPSPLGTWQGGSVTVTVRCTVENRALAGVWMSGARTVTMRDTQPVDRYQR